MLGHTHSLYTTDMSFEMEHMVMAALANLPVMLKEINNNNINNTSICKAP